MIGFHIQNAATRSSEDVLQELLRTSSELRRMSAGSFARNSVRCLQELLRTGWELSTGIPVDKCVLFGRFHI